MRTESKIISLLSVSNTGCTFLDWSILYLSGQDEFYSFKHNSYIPLISNPVTKLNAHGHEKNHYIGTDSNKTKIDIFLEKNNGLLTLYPWPLQYRHASEHYRIDIESVTFTEEITEKFKNFVFEDFQKLWLYLNSINSKIVYVSDDPDLLVAHLDGRSTEGGIKKSGPTTLDELDAEFQDLFYADSKRAWQDQNLNSIWDERERRALDLRPYDSILSTRENLIPFELPHLHITTAELWTQGESVITRVMKFCDLPIDQNRWEYWTNIYSQWKQLLEPKVSFCYRLPLILKSIINNWYYEIGELSFMQEVLIQHLLIYKYNLNLKTWGLNKFPSNTQDLHKLLESNIHPVPDIYNTRSTA